MKVEKTLILESGRSVKVVAEQIHLAKQEEIAFEILIKEPKEAHFHPPIGLSHPKYWKLKQMGPDESRSLQLRYSGVSQKQLRKIVLELKSCLPADLKHPEYAQE